MGVGFTTHDNFDFSVNIQRGDFVSLDVDMMETGITWDL